MGIPCGYSLWVFLGTTTTTTTKTLFIQPRWSLSCTYSVLKTSISTLHYIYDRAMPLFHNNRRLPLSFLAQLKSLQSYISAALAKEGESAVRWFRTMEDGLGLLRDLSAINISELVLIWLNLTASLDYQAQLSTQRASHVETSGEGDIAKGLNPEIRSQASQYIYTHWSQFVWTTVLVLIFIL